MATEDGLVGARVEVIVSDPWDFVTLHGAGPFSAVVVRPDGPGLLIRMEKAFEADGKKYRYMAVSRRTERESLADLTTPGTEDGCALVGISEEAARSAHPCDLDGWRGGFGLDGTIRSTPQRPDSPQR